MTTFTNLSEFLDLMLILDNDTRWNSQYNSISRALKLREHINLFSQRHRKELGDNILEEDDWNHLQTLKDRLWLFVDATASLEGKAFNGQHGSIWEWLPVIEGLLKEMEAQMELRKKQRDTTSWLCHAHQRAWNKLRE